MGTIKNVIQKANSITEQSILTTICLMGISCLFRFGYMQGIKAAKAAMMKGEVL